MLSVFRALWNYRGFVTTSIKSEFANRFARSRLGALWMIIFPLVQTALFALVLSSVLSSRLPNVDNKNGYALYLLAGMMAWALFSEIVTRCQTIFIENSTLLKKLAFPRICLPAIACGSAVVTNFLLFLATLIIYVLLGHIPSSNILWLPVFVVINVGFALGLGLICGILNVFIRDVGYVVGIILQLGFWLTPIVYVPSALPQRYQEILKFNPFSYIVKGYQDALVFGAAPSWQQLVIVAILTVLVLALAMALFRRASEEMVDVL